MIYFPGLMDIEKDILPMPTNKKESYDCVLQPVPVIIVGSHYDQIPAHRQQEAISNVQALVNEVKAR